MTRPCDPATLGDLCAGDCGRRLHHGRPRGASNSRCAAGHPRHDAHGMCSGCNWRATRRGRQEKAAPVYHCPHDEGEPCSCEDTP